MKYKKTPLITNLILPSIICFVLISCSQNINFITKDEKKTPRKALSFLDEEFKGTTFYTDKRAPRYTDRNFIYPYIINK